MVTSTKSKSVQSPSVDVSSVPAVIKPQGNAIPGGDLADALMGLAGPSKPTASKSKTPVVAVPQSISPLIDGYVSALQAKKDAEARVDDFFSQLEPHLTKMHVNLCQTTKKYASSLKLGGKLTFQFGGKYKKIGAEKKADLQALFAENFAMYFTAMNEVKVKAESLDMELLTELRTICEKRGVKFNDIFEVASVLKPTEKYTEDRFVSPEIKAIADQAQSSELVVPYKSALKE